MHGCHHEDNQVIVYWILSKKLCIKMSRNTNRHVEKREEMPDSFGMKEMVEKKGAVW
jgi:hypothetical protein